MANKIFVKCFTDNAIFSHTKDISVLIDRLTDDVNHFINWNNVIVISISTNNILIEDWFKYVITLVYSENNNE